MTLSYPGYNPNADVEGTRRPGFTLAQIRELVMLTADWVDGDVSLVHEIHDTGSLVAIPRRTFHLEAKKRMGTDEWVHFAQRTVWEE